MANSAHCMVGLAPRHVPESRMIDDFRMIILMAGQIFLRFRMMVRDDEQKEQR